MVENRSISNRIYSLSLVLDVYRQIAEDIYGFRTNGKIKTRSIEVVLLEGRSTEQDGYSNLLK